MQTARQRAASVRAARRGEKSLRALVVATCALLSLWGGPGRAGAQLPQLPPVPTTDAEATRLQILNADDVEYDEPIGRVTARGNVVVEYRDYRVSADVLEADLQERTATFRGQVTITTPERTLQGTLLRLNLRTRGYTLEGARIEIPPEEVQMGATAPIYATTARIRGVPGRIFIERGGVTTCNLALPHYLFDSREVDIIPGERLKARKVGVYALGHRLLTLPGITIPLRTINEQSSRFVPTVGQSLEEGYYLKSAYFYVLASLVGNLRLDLMSKKGVGIGLDQPYNFPNYNGTVHLYQLADRRNNRQDFTGRVDHRHRVGEFNFGVSGNYRRNSLDYVAASSSGLLTDFTANWRGSGGASADFGINRSASTFAGTQTGTWTGHLRHSQTFGTLRSNLSLNLSQPFGTVTASSGRLSSRLDLAQSTRPVDVNLVVDRIDTLGGTANFFAGTQRLPELRLATDTRRLFPTGFVSRLAPVTAALSIGNLREAGFTSSTSGGRDVMNRLRTYAHLSSNPQILPPSERLNLSLPIDFHQLVYRADEAQWIAGASPTLSYRLGDESQASLSYSLLRQHGFTPFQSDFFPEYNSLSLSVTLGRGIRGGYGTAYPGYGTSGIGSVGPLTGYGGYPATIAGVGNLDPAAAGRINASLDTGFDFENGIARDLTVRAQYQPTAHHLVSLSTGYDWYGRGSFGTQNRLRDLIGRLRVDYGDALQLSVGALWSTSRNKLGTVRGSLNSRLSDQWHLMALYGKQSTGFGAFSQPFTQVMLTRDLHCWEASAIYSEETVFGRRQRDLRVLLSIKAFPTNKQFGVSQSGQYFTSDIGGIY